MSLCWICVPAVRNRFMNLSILNVLHIYLRIGSIKLLIRCHLIAWLTSATQRSKLIDRGMWYPILFISWYRSVDQVCSWWKFTIERSWRIAVDQIIVLLFVNQRKLHPIHKKSLFDFVRLGCDTYIRHFWFTLLIVLHCDNAYPSLILVKLFL